MRLSYFPIVLALCAGMLSISLTACAMRNQGLLITRIRAADPTRYGALRDPRDWLNPYVVVHAADVEVVRFHRHAPS
jgi:hypothetical protein